MSVNTAIAAKIDGKQYKNFYIDVSKIKNICSENSVNKDAINRQAIRAILLKTCIASPEQNPLSYSGSK